MKNIGHRANIDLRIFAMLRLCIPHNYTGYVMAQTYRVMVQIFCGMCYDVVHNQVLSASKQLLLLLCMFKIHFTNRIADTQQ